jgi:hypothetical protein
LEWRLRIELLSSILPLDGDGESAVSVKELPELLTSQLQPVFFSLAACLGMQLKTMGSGRRVV